MVSTSPTPASDERTEPAMTSQSSASNPTTWAERPDHAGRRLHGRWLLAARVGWISLAGLALILLVIALPVFFQAAREVRTAEAAVPGQLTPTDALLLQRWGVSLAAYAAYQVREEIGG